MFEKNYYTLRSVADELNIGESTIQYWQDQYPSWIPYKDNEKEKWYPRQAIGVLRFIIESADSGMSEGDIEKELSIRYPMVNEHHKQEIPLSDKMSGKQIMSGDSVSGVLKGLLEGLSRQQMRIADAQERRAAAEERKAAALEKRAEAQKLMADALNNVAFALQHTTLPGSVDIRKNGSSFRSETRPGPVADDHATAAKEEEDRDNEMQERVVNSLLDDVSEDSAASDTSYLDDLSELLVDPEEISASDTDVLSDLAAISPEEAASEVDDLSELLKDPEEISAEDTDDLSDLLAGSSEETASDLDDLSELLEDVEAGSASDTDDLSDLLASSSAETASELDDLSELLEGMETTSASDTTDPSGLTSISDEVAEVNLDDLSALLENPLPETDRKSDAPPETVETVSEKSDKGQHADTKAPDITGKAEQAKTAPGEPTKKIPGDYKSKIIALIIQLKEKKGMGIDAVTEYMNTKGYKTISGKEKWDSNTITQIFEHIKRVRAENE